METPKRILIVDDDEQTRGLMAALVASLGHDPESAEDGFGALAKLKLDIDLVMLDVMMPGMDGFEVARRMRQDADDGDVPIIMVTGLADSGDRLSAVKAGVNDFITKPVDRTDLEVRIGSLLGAKEKQDAIKRHQSELEVMVEKRTQALRRALGEMAEAQRQLHEAHVDTIYRLALAAEQRDSETGAHIHRISGYCAVLGKGMGLPPGDVERLRHASVMHDVGKLGIPEAILLKPGKLTPEEMQTMKEHTTIGGRILRGSPSDVIRLGEVIAMSHHEKWDGSGYPKGLAGEEIPVWGRICAVADVFDALTSERPYKEAYTNERAYQILLEGRGSHFDPDVIDVFFQRAHEIEAIQREYCESRIDESGASEETDEEPSPVCAA